MFVQLYNFLPVLCIGLVVNERNIEMRICIVYVLFHVVMTLCARVLWKIILVYLSHDAANPHPILPGSASF